MLDMLDVVIGFVLVMLVMSMAVTLLTQLIGTGLLNLQGKALKIGITSLLELLDPDLKSGGAAAKIADHLLRNPLVGKPALFGGVNHLAAVVHREELVKLVLDFAIPGDLEAINRAELDEERQLRFDIRESLAKNGIADPQQVLKQVRDTVIELEKSNPELSQSSRINIAILNFAGSEFLSKLNSWFDQTIDRVSGIFTGHTRVVTFAVSIVLALFVQLDSFDLINRLSVDDNLRNSLVKTAVDTVDKRERAQNGGAAVPAPASSPTARSDATAASGTAPDDAADAPNSAEPVNAAAPSDAAEQPAPVRGETCAGACQDGGANPSTEQVVSQLKQVGLGDLEEFGIIGFPRSWSDWTSRWTAMTTVPPSTTVGGATRGRASDATPGNVGAATNTASSTAGAAAKAQQGGAFDLYRVLVHLLGILLSAALLSLGAPWWYAVLRDLVKLRSIVARKDDEQRAERQSTQAPAGNTPGAGGVPPMLAGGEAGDMTATG